MNNGITRRALASSLGRAVVCFGAFSMLAPALLRADETMVASRRLSSREIDALAAYAYTLLPILKPTDPRYRTVALKMAHMSERNAAVFTMIRQSLKPIELPDTVVWSSLSPQRLTDLIQPRPETPLFNILRWNTAEIVMRDPTLWADLGYQGSAIEFGGYTHRGFDDIDWLPQSRSGVKQ